MNNEKSVKYEYEENDKKIVVIFDNPPTIKDPASFRRTHYFTDIECTKITTNFKNKLLELFKVSNIDDLKAVIAKNNITLTFEPGEGEIIYDPVRQEVIVYTETFNKTVIKPANQEKRVKKNIVAALKHEQMTSSNYAELVTTVLHGASEVELSEADKALIAREIPNLIRNKHVKISLHDITDINKQNLHEIVQLGRDILNKKRGVEKKLGIDRQHIGKEFAWQKYFELYGTYLLFGSIEEQIPESLLELESQFRMSDSRLDILTINRYGFLDLVELKRSDEYLFKFDNSHDNIVPTSSLSTAISQVNNYLMLLPYSKDIGELTKGAESATGMLIIGSTKYLMRPGDISAYAQKHNIQESIVNKKIRKALRDLNYSYSHIQIALYDEILDNLERFINKMDIEVHL